MYIIIYTSWIITIQTSPILCHSFSDYKVHHQHRSVKWDKRSQKKTVSLFTKKHTKYSHSQWEMWLFAFQLLTSHFPFSILTAPWSTNLLTFRPRRNMPVPSVWIPPVPLPPSKRSLHCKRCLLKPWCESNFGLSLNSWLHLTRCCLVVKGAWILSYWK